MRIVVKYTADWALRALAISSIKSLLLLSRLRDSTKFRRFCLERTERLDGVDVRRGRFARPTFESGGNMLLWRY